MKKKILQIQHWLDEKQIDGWLIYDNHGSNRFAHKLLEIPPHLVITRRFFYWIPRQGEPKKILHTIESESLNMLPGLKYLYLSWTDLEKVLEKVLNRVKVVIMEYSPRNLNPNISVVDAGTIEVIRSFGIEIKSSADLVQHHTSVLNESQIASHFEAATVLETIFSKVWDLIANAIWKKQNITEYDVQKFILSEFTAYNCITEDSPTCSVNEHSALPHYRARKDHAHVIRKGDFILIDMWCKKNVPESIYADLTRVGIAAPQPTPYQEEVFKIVKGGLIETIDYIDHHIKRGLSGCEVDDFCRQYITRAGYGEYFIHRTGHNIDTHVHGAGVNFDNLEMADHRKILPGMCFSIEPGIYLSGTFGVRIEYNLLIASDYSIRITGGKEENIICFL
ncbi:MAG: Xaa-Pro peptidase family protein [Chlamydiales bacterium]